LKSIFFCCGYAALEKIADYPVNKISDLLPINFRNL